MIDDILKIGTFIVSILPSERRNIDRLTKELVNSIRNEQDIKKEIILAKVQDVYDYDNSKIENNKIYKKVVSSLLLKYHEQPPRQLTDEVTQKIIERLTALLNSVEPMPPSSKPPLIKTQPPGGESNGSKNGGRGGYGKPIMDYMLDVYDGMEDGREYPLAEIKQRLSEKVKAQSRKELDKGTRDLQIKKATVNEKNRVHFGAISPDDEGQYSFFYYPDENSKDTVKKFHKGIKDNPTIYYTNGGQRESKKMSEIFND
jgi:hypothetical protein